MNSVKKLMFRRSACTGLRCRDMITVICGVTKFKECDWKPFFDNSDVASIHPSGIKKSEETFNVSSSKSMLKCMRALISLNPTF